MIGLASTWLVLTVTSPSPSPTPSGAFNGPNEDQFSGSGDSVSAGLYAFLIIVMLAAFTALIIFFMNRSLKRARQNLGGDVLPRRQADQIPVAPGGPDDPDRTPGSSPSPRSEGDGDGDGPTSAASEP